MIDQPQACASTGVHETVLELVTRLPVSTVLDAPVGHGALTARLLERGKVVTAGDIDIEQFDLNPDQPNLQLVQLNLTAPQLPLADDSFDLAVCLEGVEHLENQWQLVRNLHRVLKPGGYLILSTPNIINFKSRFRFFTEARYEFFKRPMVLGKSIEHDLNCYHIAPVSYFELQFILESCGFAIRELHANIYSSKNFVSAFLRPFFRAFYRYKCYRDKKRNRGDFAELYKTVMSDELYYGEILIIMARKKE
ncbi:MAG TPA: class I SAM-dependent methyltransferase [Geobacteraceae bacterium]|nr:class I SAM-dependent methyltransferase [Geobacteraceae bacterium]